MNTKFAALAACLVIAQRSVARPVSDHVVTEAVEAGTIAFGSGDGFPSSGGNDGSAAIIPIPPFNWSTDPSTMSSSSSSSSITGSGVHSTPVSMPGVARDEGWYMGTGWLEEGKKGPPGREPEASSADASQVLTPTAFWDPLSPAVQTSSPDSDSDSDVDSDFLRRTFTPYYVPAGSSPDDDNES
ncbi:hypothetical protein L226DRAFT_573312 [Lentinus tigrinus ALCF2SS1-7]|uniref:Uncharacterized protein n=1 Tax=Lentinus tigrinus ALCF2SS1-6 TaxID=1328759 RepID=A0A5C2S3I0_9APHY|nr:hypothetical protein L227DRAFT_602137 [Lentinus tigrinus ALCF2SS1-6]RPD72258.1 hypothetical protein L226DRAFT_573312 [Lentinus tigrinus ALCF2SS1-7]